MFFAKSRAARCRQQQCHPLHFYPSERKILYVIFPFHFLSLAFNTGFWKRLRRLLLYFIFLLCPTLHPFLSSPYYSFIFAISTIDSLFTLRPFPPWFPRFFFRRVASFPGTSLSYLKHWSIHPTRWKI